MLNKRVFNNLKISLYGLSLFNMAINPISVYADDIEVVSFQNDESGIKIYDFSSGNFISYDTLLNECDLLTKLRIEISGNWSDFSFLKQCSNLTRLDIYNLNGSVDLSFLDGMPNLSSLVVYEKVPFSNDNLNQIVKCKNLEYLSINSPGYFDVSCLLELEKLNSLMIYNGIYQNINMLKNCSGLDTLQIKIDEAMPGNLFESMTFLKKLKLDVSKTCNVDYKKLTFLDELNFVSPKSYTIAVDFTNDDFNILTENNVKVTAIKDNKDLMDEVRLINNDLDVIVSGLNVLPDDTDQEKLDKILIYVFDHLSYDKNINNNNAYVLGSKYYEPGLLYQALVNGNNAICGNYAALVSALAKRVDLKCIYLQNKDHAWNLVKIDGVYYGVDATFLDGQYVDASKQLMLGNHNLDWYLIPLDKLNDSYHVPRQNPVLSSNNTNKVLQIKMYV